NCGCPDQIAIGRRKGLGGKDTLCGECGKYIHRFKRNRPTLYNPSADYHTSLKLEADKAKQAIADQEILRKDKNKTENQNLSSSLNSSKKRKKDGRNSLLPKSELIRRGEERADSVVSSNRSAASRESSPVGSVRSNKNSGPTEKPPPKKRAPTTRAQKSISKTIVVDSPEPGQSPPPDSHSPIVARSQSTSTSQPAKPSRVSSRRSSTKAEKILPKKVLIKNEEDLDQPTSKSPSVSGTRQENNQKRKQLRSKDQSDNKAKKGSKTPEEDQEEEEDQTKSSKLAPGGSRTGSISVELFPRPKKQAISPGTPPVIVGYDWRLKCVDCPGKLYTVGPGESFTNFHVHLKNRQHRTKQAEVSHQHPQLSPYDGSQQISPTNDLHQQRSRTGSQISPTENGQQVPSRSSNGHTNREVNPIISLEYAQSIEGPDNLADQHLLPTAPTSASLPPITTTLAAAESTAPQDQEPARSPGPDGDEEVVAGDHSSRSPTDNNVPPAPSSLDGVALQENNYMDYSRDDEDDEEEGEEEELDGVTTTGLPPMAPRCQSIQSIKNNRIRTVIGRPDLPAKPTRNSIDGSGSISLGGGYGPPPPPAHSGLPSSRSSLSAPSNHLPPFLNRSTGGQGTHLPSSHHNHHNQLHYLPNHNHNHHPNQHHHQLHGHAHGNSNGNHSSVHSHPLPPSSSSSANTSSRLPPQTSINNTSNQLPLVHPLPKKPTFD
ncbi:hypothetical protein PSHT_16475, partial [Puccinia striiformis]